MELIKNNINYSISDKFETWTITGSLNKDMSGSIDFNININGELENVGTAYYSKSADSNLVNVNYNVNEANLTKFVTYFNKLVEQVLQTLKEEI